MSPTLTDDLGRPITRPGAHTIAAEVDQAIDRSLHVVNLIEQETKDDGAAVADAVAVVEREAASGGPHAVEYVTRWVKALERKANNGTESESTLTRLLDRADSARPSPMPDAAVMTPQELREREAHDAAVADARYRSVDLECTLRQVRLWQKVADAALARRAAAALIVARRLRVERAARRVQQMRDELAQLKTWTLDDGDVGHIVRATEMITGQACEAPTIAWGNSRLVEPTIQS